MLCCIIIGLLLVSYQAFERIQMMHPCSMLRGSSALSRLQILDGELERVGKIDVPRITWIKAVQECID